MAQSVHRVGFFSLFTSACDSYILSFDFLATISAQCNWKMQTRECEAGTLPRPSAYGNVDLADGVCGYLCMSNFALLWLKRTQTEITECLFCLWAIDCVLILFGFTAHCLGARFILPRSLMCVCIEAHSTWSAFTPVFKIYNVNVNTMSSFVTGVKALAGCC